MLAAAVKLLPGLREVDGGGCLALGRLLVVVVDGGFSAAWMGVFSSRGR